MPDIHCCYDCLLKDAVNKGELRGKLQALAKTRRLLHAVRTQGVGTEGQLAKDLGEYAGHR